MDGDEQHLLNIIDEWQPGHDDLNVKNFSRNCKFSLDTFEDFAKNNRLWIPDMECLRKFYD